MSGDLKITRIRAQHQSELSLLGDTVKLAQSAVPKLRRTAENRVAFRNMADSMSALGAYVRANGFDPTRKFQHVANYDTEIWTLVLEMFAKYETVKDPVTGIEREELRDDGLLYKWDHEKGCLRLNKDFFFALLSYFESEGISCDMRGKIKLN
jgi:hypothetical protein